jgi:MFS family permease
MSGLAIAPGPISAAIAAAPMGRLAVQWGHARVLLLGALCLAFGTAMFSFTIDTTPNYVSGLLPWMILTGFGVGCSMSTLSSAASAFLPPARFAMGSALNTTMRQIGSALGAALATSLAAPAMKNLFVAMTNKEPVTRTMVSSYFTAWRVMAAIYLFAGIVMIVLYKKPTEQQMTDAGQVEFVD